MVKDEKGKFWTGTNRGLNYFDPETGLNQRIAIPGKGLNYSVGALHFINQDSLFVNTGNGEIYLFEVPFKRWIKTKINTKIPLAGSFYSMGERGVGLGITKSEGFLLYDAASNEWVQLPNKKYLSL